MVFFIAKYKIIILDENENEEIIAINADSYLLHYKETECSDMEFIGNGFIVTELGETLKKTIDFITNECID